MYPDMLKEFWSTCEYHPSKNYISGFVCEGKYLIKVTIKGLRDTLKLPHYNEFDPLVTVADVERILGRCGYNFSAIEESKATDLRGKILKSGLPAIWNYLSVTVMRSLGTKAGSYHEVSRMEQQIFHSLVTGTNIDYAELIFNELKKKVLKQRRDVYVPYPRFLSLVFQKTMGNKYTKSDLKFVAPKLVRHRITRYDVEGGHSKLTSAMRRTIKNPYEHLQSKSEADSSSSEADSSDSEADSSDSESNSSDSEPVSSSHCKSTSFSPSNSCCNSTLRGVSKVIPPKTNPTPPPPLETSEASSSQLSKSPSINKSSETKTGDKGQHTPSKVTAATATLEAIADMDIDNHAPNQDTYFTPSPSHIHHSSPNTTQQDPPTDTSAILQAIMALTSKVDTISSNQQDHQINTDAILQSITALTCKVDVMSSNLENIKSYMAALPTNTTTQQDQHEQEITTLKAQNQSHHTSVQGLTSQVSALESEMKAVHHTLHTLQDNTVTFDAKLTEDIDAIKTQHFCFSVQLENFKNFQGKVHATAINTQTAVNKLNEQVSKLVKASTYQQPAAPFSSDKDDSKTSRFKRKRG
ncbi:hypothetical protein CTI12_AA555720 [Artemisia annua]|uniref:Uncharacterized protein n=1 Tax=Artemisia annua TaxID=35608 RepID=A0A2U1KWK8_ARTAN|nr:hypothetical protein CTI12_AA555720 [Artemisia annua]